MIYLSQMCQGNTPAHTLSQIPLVVRKCKPQTSGEVYEGVAKFNSGSL